jgi:hypothetical protein
MVGRRRPARRVVASAVLALALSAAVAPNAAFAADEPNGNASCMGLEQASISPPGTSDEGLGGARQFVGEVKELAAFFGVKPGALFSFIASLHAGSHAECDEVLDG